MPLNGYTMMKKLSLIIALIASMAPIIAHAMEMDNQKIQTNNADHQQQPVTNNWQQSCGNCCLAATFLCCLATVAPVVEAYLIVRNKFIAPKTARHME